MITRTQAGMAFLLASASLFSVPLRATSVVALIDKASHTLVVAADCRVTRELAWGSECKIIEEPGCVVAIAGLYEERTTAFNLRQLAIAACRYPGDLRAKAETFLRLSKIPYERAVRHIRDKDPSDFRRTIENKPTEVIFAGLQGNHLALFVRGLVSDTNGRVTPERYESTDATKSSIGYFAGLNRHIREHVSSHGQWEHLGYPAAARQFVEMEIRENPDLAGPPISELEIDSRGTVRWISRGACDAAEAD
jgi:hypothetical protein